ncbi:MAG TPA: sirohydrochlorin cobaltochelatase [Nitrospinae bacterium]|nr:sirohydrochlorin cobaltochelatase [Nitrospinota bacterium]
MHVIEKNREIDGRTAVLLLGHGSRAAEANGAMHEVIRRLQEKWPGYVFGAAFLEINFPSIPEGIDFHAGSGAERIILLPYFLHLGNHVQKDLPRFVEEGRKRHPTVEISLGGHLGFHPKLVEVAEERFLEALEAVPSSSPF